MKKIIATLLIVGLIASILTSCDSFGSHGYIVEIDDETDDTVDNDGSSTNRDQEKEENEAILEVLPGAKNIVKMVISEDYPEEITKGFKADNGYVFTAEVTGKSEGMVIMVGISKEGKVTGTKVISHNETPMYMSVASAQLEGTRGRYNAMTYTSFQPQMVSGATLTSNGFADAVKIALAAASIASGHSVDTGISINDTCNFALGTKGKTFERWFRIEAIDNVTNIYSCDEGVVVVFGDEYVGITNEGNIANRVRLGSSVILGMDYETQLNTEIALLVYLATLENDYCTEVAIPSGASKRVTKVERTFTDNYIIYVEAAGFGINGNEYASGSGEFIELAVCIGTNGVIIDVVTLSRGTESKGFGDVCETDAYTEQFRGAAAHNIVITEEGESAYSGDLGIISGATVTSNGYQQALKNAFAVFELLTK